MTGLFSASAYPALRLNSLFTSKIPCFIRAGNFATTRYAYGRKAPSPSLAEVQLVVFPCRFPCAGIYEPTRRQSGQTRDKSAEIAKNKSVRTGVTVSAKRTQSCLRDSFSHQLLARLVGTCRGNPIRVRCQHLGGCPGARASSANLSWMEYLGVVGPDFSLNLYEPKNSLTKQNSQQEQH